MEDVERRSRIEFKLEIRSRTTVRLMTSTVPLNKNGALSRNSSVLPDAAKSTAIAGAVPIIERSCRKSAFHRHRP